MKSITGFIVSACLLIAPLGSAVQAAALAAADVTFNFNAGTPAVLDSVTIGGNTLSSFVAADSIGFQFQNPSAVSQFIVEANGSVSTNVTNPGFAGAILAANADRNLTRYLSMDPPIINTDFVDYKYTGAIASSASAYLVVTERNGNNTLSAIALDINGDPTGNSVDAIQNPGGTYIDTGVTELFANQNINATVFPLTDLVNVGVPIYGIRVTQSGAPAGGGDGGDGMVFIIAAAGVGQNTLPAAGDDFMSTAENTPVTFPVLDNDDANDAGQTLTIVSNTNSASGSVVDNGDGTFTYTPNVGFTGTDTFTYTISDGTDTATATVTITVGNDFDGDLILDVDDIDDDNDGILDTEEDVGNLDFDMDGSPNSRDLDADGDGILDMEESGLNEAQQASLDTNGDGQIDLGNVFGANGLADEIETAPESGSPDYSNNSTADTPVNTDAPGDGQPDFLDLDSDNDGISDVIEARFIDADGDGEMDAGQTPTMNPANNDSDPLANYRDLDSDNDGLTDIIEAGLTDNDQDGRIDNFADADGDGYDDVVEASPAPVPNTDGDTVPNYLDLDSDNDGVTDATEGGLLDVDGDGEVDGFADEDGDGYDDATAASPASIPNTDGDSVPDYLDRDSDNDGITDTEESGLADVDGDGIVDGFTDPGNGYNPGANPAPLTDTDDDGTPDMLELDSDGDGVFDIVEAGLFDTNGDGLVDNFTDTDGDGYDDAVAISPAPVLDANGNGINDYQEPGFQSHSCDCILITGVDGHGASLNWLALLALALLGVVRLVSKKRFKSGLAIVSAVLLAAPLMTSAEDSPDSRDFDNRLYLGVGAGITQLEPESSCGCEKVDDDTDGGYQLFLGYDLSQRFSLEGYYAELGEAGIATRDDIHEGEVSYQHYGISLLGYLFNSRGGENYDDSNYDDEGLYSREGLSGFARIGVGVMDNSSTNVTFRRENDAHLHLGAGLEYGWANGFAARGEFISYDTDAKILMVSLLKRFGDVTRTTVKKPDPAPEITAKEVEPAPAPAPVVVKAPEVCNSQVLDGVTFHTNASTLTSDAMTYLSGVAATLGQGACSSISVVGHTDSRGSAAYNIKLSEARARSVAQYLQSQGIHGSSFEGKGESEPRATNDTAEGRALNRRVELLVK